MKYKLDFMESDLEIDNYISDVLKLEYHLLYVILNSDEAILLKLKFPYVHLRIYNESDEI